MLICHHDLTSPAAAVAVLRLQRLRDAGGNVGFQGLDLLGLDVALPATLDQFTELESHADRAAALGLSMRRPRWRPPTLAAHLVAVLADDVELGASWRATTLRAYWTDGADIADTDVLVTLAGEAGLDAARVRDLLADRRARLDLRRRMIATRGRGIGGVPVLEYLGTFVSAELPDEDLAQLAAL